MKPTIAPLSEPGVQLLGSPYNCATWGYGFLVLYTPAGSQTFDYSQVRALAQLLNRLLRGEGSEKLLDAQALITRLRAMQDRPTELHCTTSPVQAQFDTMAEVIVMLEEEARK